MAVNRKRRCQRFNKPPTNNSYRRKTKTKLNKLLNFSPSLPAGKFTLFIQGDLKLKFKRLPVPLLDGYRIINLDQLQNHVSDITMHAALCEKAQICALHNRPVVKLVTERQRLGLASIIQAQCQGCGHLFLLQTSHKIKTSSGLKRYDINLRAVWGSMATGSGHSQLAECLGTMGIPTMSQPTFTSIEHEIGTWWRNALKADMKVAGAEEKKLAEARNDYFYGVPAVTVVCDGGWSKRSHKHSYNALGGVGIVMGLATRKLLHIGIRNKYCYICDSAKNHHTDPVEHECFKNWEDSSQAMESDIIVEGFLNAENDHGIRYMRIIADGDSSVYARIQETVPIWGPHVAKLECANHVCKCLRSSLEKLVDRLPSLKGKGKLTLATRIRIVSAVRCAIRMRSSDDQETRRSMKLEHDIKNSIFHIFGKHDNCSEFCLKSAVNSDNTPPTNTVAADEENDSVISVLDDQLQFWSDGASLQSQEESRVAVEHCDLTPIQNAIIKEVQPLLNRVAAKAGRLLGNFTTNLAESWMHIRAKFDGGKFFNRCNRGSWHARCYGGALRQNLGPKWSPDVWQTVTGTSSGSAFSCLYNARERKRQTGCLLSARPVVKARRWKRKTAGKINTQKADHEYGPNAVDVVADYSPNELSKKMDCYYRENIVVSKDQGDAIQSKSRLQSKSDLWHVERRKRLTSSNFGAIMKRNVKIKTEPLVRRLLHSDFKGNKSTAIGLGAEKATIVEYCQHMKDNGKPVQVEPAGLCISLEHPSLAASTDGIVTCRTTGQTGLLEIKNVLLYKKLTFLAACKSVSGFCLGSGKGDKLQLKTSHNFYWQVQGQLNIFGLDWVDFVVRATNPYQLHVERISRNSSLWETTMLPKLTAFYQKCLLPELTAPRYGKSPGIREPGVWFSDKGKKRCKPPPSLLPLSVASTSSASTKKRSRTSKQKFVGRQIRHKWQEDDSSDTCKWYRGTVISAISGIDGEAGTVYDIFYDSEDENYTVDHLYEDYAEGSVQFTDL